MAKKSKKPRVQSIKMYLLKQTVTQYKDALRDKQDFQEFDLRPGLGFTGKLFLRKPEHRSACRRPPICHWKRLCPSIPQRGSRLTLHELWVGWERPFIGDSP